MRRPPCRPLLPYMSRREPCRSNNGRSRPSQAQTGEEYGEAELYHMAEAVFPDQEDADYPEAYYPEEDDEMKSQSSGLSSLPQSRQSRTFHPPGRPLPTTDSRLPAARKKNPPSTRSAARHAADVPSRPASTKVTRGKRLTGLEADFASLSLNRSSDVVENVKLTLRAHLTTFQWKKFVWMLRMRAAMEEEQMRWRRNPRWLAHMFGKELAWLWGHVGGARQQINMPKNIPLFGAEPGR